ncbi:MAG TPA: MOSC domain-containing protein [Gaiellaceae bacterium]|nr:MOSC domain-containing protein [Gaiellaceae bacterium]
MRLVSVNAGRAEPMKIGARTVTTGIRKGPVERGHVGALGLAGDVVADEENHGGPDQALYLYSAEDYAWWADELGGVPEPGTFGENLTLSGFGPEPVRIGDRFRIGEALVEVTAPRIPCSVFATRMGEADWVKRFAAARRPGLYVRVLEPGEVGAGDPVERLASGNGHPTVVDLMDVWYDAEPEPELLERLLASPLAVRARENVERKLARVAGDGP